MSESARVCGLLPLVNILAFMLVALSSPTGRIGPRRAGHQCPEARLGHVMVMFSSRMRCLFSVRRWSCRASQIRGSAGEGPLPARSRLIANRHIVRHACTLRKSEFGGGVP